MKEVVPVKRAGGTQLVEQCQSGGRATIHCKRDGMVQLDDGRGDAPQKLLVQRLDLRPVRFLVALRASMERADRRLDLIGTGPAHPQGPFEQLAPLLDLHAVPERAVLVLEQHDAPVRRHAGPPASIVEEH